MEIFVDRFFQLYDTGEILCIYFEGAGSGVVSSARYVNSKDGGLRCSPCCPQADSERVR